jgi:hypothetical protein
MKTTLRSLCLALIALSLASCAKVLNAPMYQTGTVSHVVVCYLKNHGNAADRQKIVDASRELRTISGVYDVEVGTVLPSDRPIVVSDFDVAIIATFRDQAAMHAYLKDPTHLKAVKEVLEPLVAKTVVYDIVNQE